VAVAPSRAGRRAELGLEPALEAVTDGLSMES